MENFEATYRCVIRSENGGARLDYVRHQGQAFFRSAFTTRQLLNTEIDPPEQHGFVLKAHVSISAITVVPYLDGKLIKGNVRLYTPLDGLMDFGATEWRVGPRGMPAAWCPELVAALGSVTAEKLARELAIHCRVLPTPSEITTVRERVVCPTCAAAPGLCCDPYYGALNSEGVHDARTAGHLASEPIDDGADHL